MSTPHLAAGPLAINLNQPGTHLHRPIFDVSLANLPLIPAMVLVFGAALVLPFPEGAPGISGSAGTVGSAAASETKKEAKP